MKNRNKFLLLLGVIVVAIGLALWPRRRSPPNPAQPASEASQPPRIAPAPGPSSSAATHPEPAVVLNAASNPQRKFADMGVLEANAILVKIEKQELALIFQAMLNAKRVEQDSTKQLAIQSVLATAMKTKTPPPEFMERMREFITDSSNPKFDRYLVLGVLTGAASKETVDLLIEVATTSADQEMKQAAIGGLADVGNLGGAGEKLSPALDRVWREANDQQLLTSVAIAMAKIGAPSSIDLLLSAALAADGQDHFRLATAQQMLTNEVYRANAVPPLIARLADQSPKGESAKLIAPILVRIGNVTAGKAVVSWLQGTTESAAPLIRDLIVQRTTNPAMSAAWAAALNPEVPFRNEQNREAIRAGLDERKAGIKH